MYILHYRPDSASLAVRLVLEELGQPYRAALLDRESGQQDNPAYRALHPLGLIPTLETPDGPIFETSAILLWLADHHHALAPQPDAPARAAFLKWFLFTSNNIHPTLMQLFYPERFAGSPAAIPGFLGLARNRMQSYLSLLDTMVTREHPAWLSATQPSILGYYLCVLLRWLKSYPADHPAHFAAAAYPALNAIAAGLEQRPAALAAATAEDLGTTIFTDPFYPDA